MEFEKTLFRVHERFLSSDGVKKSVHFCYIICTILMIIVIPMFIYANVEYVNQNKCLGPYIKDLQTELLKSNQTIGSDDIFLIQIAEFKENNGINDTINNDTNLAFETIYQSFEFSGNLQVLTLSKDVREKHNFTNYNITIDATCYSSMSIGRFFIYQFIDYENILINEIIMTFKGLNRTMKNVFTNEIWVWQDYEIQSYIVEQNFMEYIIIRFFGLLRILFGLFLVSNITAIYTKMTIICAPIFILAAYSCCQQGDTNISRINIYRTFPWIGIYLYALNANGRRKDRYMIFAFVCMITVFYCLYLSALFIWNTLLFYKSIPKGLDENFYAIIAFLEFLSLLFARTRTTLKFFPIMSITILMMFLYYVQFTPYGFYNMALFLTTYSILGLLTYMLDNFEIPALNWNPFHHYTPSLESPRTMYFPIFSLNWYHDLPQIWTMFYPLFGRSTFTTAQMSMIDRNYLLLSNTIANAVAARNNANQNNGGGDGGFIPNPFSNVNNSADIENNGNNINQEANQHHQPNSIELNPIQPLGNNNSIGNIRGQAHSNVRSLEQNEAHNYLIDSNTHVDNPLGPAGSNSSQNLNALRLNWRSGDEENNYRRLV